MRAIRFSQTGGPEVLEWVDVDTPRPGPGQVLVRHVAIGVNFIDTYHRTGLYPVPLPCTPGGEAAGEVEAIGEGVTRFRVGDSVAYASGLGAYAEFNLVPEGRLVSVPDSLGVVAAAAVLLKGMTVEFLLNRCYRVQAGQTILIHAGAGGVGQLMVPWAKALGATVITTVGSAEKADWVRELGADHVILYREQDVAKEVRRITDGEGVPVAYDSVGKDTFEGTLGSIARRGTLVTFGNASGAPAPFPPGRLAQAGSLYLTRPTLVDYVATTEELDASAEAVWKMAASQTIRIKVGQTFPLAEAAQAHVALESRATVGASLLIP